MSAEIIALIIVWIVANISIALPVHAVCVCEFGIQFFMGHRFKNIEWHGKILIILFNIIFAPMVFIIGLFYAIVNVFSEEE